MAYGKYPAADSQLQFDLSRYIPVSVNTTFNVLGEMRPDMIQIVNLDESKETFKILGIKSHKNISGGIQYVCVINSYNCKKEINLFFFVKQCTWYIEK
ncbi:hypothetical protein [Lachnotalea glycerini]|uniref:Uncharacterized protein n=1 Tax=Lachnotalea glycerini TaxID=1763509 RepID=A0A371JBP4_9FIRM|nr:hypothetical protein [Lachnotalea glycerini]RDY30174.1 hypothetical protein CG710_016185 [Lachnotalea glycerini]